MTFEEFWKENYEKEFGTSEPYYGIASYAFEKGQENCNCVYTDNSKVIQKLEREAELKEKRITELAMRLEDTEKELANYHIKYLFFKKLSKENAELKSIADFQTGSNMDRYFQLKRSKEQLTKAKEIIKKFSEFVNIEVAYIPEHTQEISDKLNGLCEQAEQFLKEIEK